MYTVYRVSLHIIIPRPETKQHLQNPIFHVKEVYSLCFGMRQNMTFEVSGLSKFFIAPVKRTDIRSVTCMYPYVRSKKYMHHISCFNSEKEILLPQIEI